jgi:hypothetical protein
MRGKKVPNAKKETKVLIRLLKRHMNSISVDITNVDLDIDTMNSFDLSEASMYLGDIAHDAKEAEDILEILAARAEKKEADE